MRLDPQRGESIDRSRPISFTFAGWKITGFEGDTIASAAFASGKRVFSRSFKYHRPRGLLCCSGHCPNCMMTVDGVPNVRVCVEALYPGAVVTPQNIVDELELEEELPGVEVIAPGVALGIWEGNLVPVDCGTVLHRFRAERVVVA